MPTIKFAGIVAERLRANLEGRLPLLEQAVEALRINGVDDPNARAWMVECLACAAWGADDRPYKQYGGRIKRFESLSGHNGHIYSLTHSERPVVLDVEGWKRIEMGTVTGFSAVLPLTRDGFGNYLFRVKAATELVEEDIVPNGYRPHSVDFALLAAAVDVPTLKDYLRGIPSYPKKAPPGGTIHKLFADMARQLGRFLPFVQLTRDERGVVRAESHRPRGVLPSLVCPLSGRGMGQPNIEKMGFEEDGRDKRGHALWKLDFDELNESTDSARFKRVYKVLSYVDKFRR